MNNEKTLAEAMAIAVLKGDMTAAYALADLLSEQRSEGFDAQARAAEETRNHPIAADSFEVYRWPEFQAFCNRAGILWDLRTMDLVIRLESGRAMTVDQRYRGSNVRPDAVETTSVHNQTWATHAPVQPQEDEG